MISSIQDVILALDMGAAHVGVAVYTPQVGILPVKTLHYRNQHELLLEVTRLISEYRAVRVVIGDMGLKNPPVYLKHLIDRIGKSGMVRVDLISERLTTFTPKYGSENDFKQQNLVGDDHVFAAVRILGDYLIYLQDGS